MRGGSWNNGAGNLRSAQRNNNSPGNRNNNYGFRLASSRRRRDDRCPRTSVRRHGIDQFLGTRAARVRADEEHSGDAVLVGPAPGSRRFGVPPCEGMDARTPLNGLAPSVAGT